MLLIGGVADVNLAFAAVHISILSDSYTSNESSYEYENRHILAVLTLPF